MKNLTPKNFQARNPKTPFETCERVTGKAPLGLTTASRDQNHSRNFSPTPCHCHVRPQPLYTLCSLRTCRIFLSFPLPFFCAQRQARHHFSLFFSLSSFSSSSALLILLRSFSASSSLQLKPTQTTTVARVGGKRWAVCVSQHSETPTGVAAFLAHA